MYNTDVTFIGTGHACWHAALMLRQAGRKVAMVEEDRVAGTCTNWGCNAKILLDTPFSMIDGLSSFEGKGLDALPAVNWESLMAYKKKVINPVYKALEGLFGQAGIELHRGHGRLLDAHTVTTGSETWTSEYIVIGTGERPAVREYPGNEYAHDSRDFLDLEHFPKRIAFIDGGIISMEFASIALKMGAETTVIHHNDRLLKMYPEKYVNRLTEKMKKEGARFALGCSVKKIEKQGAEYAVTLSDGSVLTCDYVLEATGRIPNVENLGLEETGIAFSAHGIRVNEYMQTSLENVYASGDCVEKRLPKLTPTATFESNYIAAHILGLNPAPIHYPAIPNLVFTLPRIAQAGVTVAEAQSHPELYRIETVPFGQRLLFMAKNDPEVDFTYIFDKENHLVGCAVYGGDADVLIDTAALIINKQMTAAELSQMIFAFPTVTYGFITMMLPLMAGGNH